MMSIYPAALNLRVGGGQLFDGLITITDPWRVIYDVAAALIGLGIDDPVWSSGTHLALRRCETWHIVKLLKLSEYK